MPKKEVLEALLRQGYFPKELPPAFTTDDFGRQAEDIIGDWSKSKLFKIEPGKLPKKKNKRDCYSYSLPSAEIEVISTPKRGYERRDVHVTHPIPQALLTLEMAQNWRSVQKWLARQHYSMDEIRVSSQYPRAIKGINFALHRVKKSYIEASADWLVKTDITRFYPSIYTHSIPWAAYGKERVKGSLNSYKGSVADRFDALVRACNRNQTVGIPIGPETSRILAEVISSRIDSDFRAVRHELPADAVDRLQDDWFLGLKSLEAAESALASIVGVYRSYGLDINGSKTSVARMVAHTEEAWISELGAFLSHRSGTLSGSRLREFLTLTLRLQAQHEKSAVTNYALTVLENHSTNREDVETLESFLLKAAVVSPGSMSRICELLLNIEHRTKAISRKRVGPRFTELAERNLINGNLYEAIWQLYALRGLRISVNSRVISELSAVTPSSALALVLLDLDSRGLWVRQLPKANWEAGITKERVRCDWIWLLAYEGFRKGWLKDTR
ncbi:MAG: RNA-directed DNA polymerase, partial [Betaproteobacteria bacterium]|nr:RNA-directed DNA polymerase [Betaproteobacteria bacterium]